jgi:hypothetical protein
MSEAMNNKPTPAATNAAGSTSSEKALVRLVRHAMQGRQPVEPAADGSVRIGAEQRSYPAALLAEAVSLGLVSRAGRLLEATPEARSFLRRAKADSEEACLAQHRDLEKATVEIDGMRQTVNRNLEESPLSALGRLKGRGGELFFPVEAIDAGDRLLADFTRAQLQPRVTASWEPRLSARAKGGSGGMADIAASAMEARRRFGRAMEAMGPELSGVAADVCCFGKGLELVERERQWPARSAKLMLRTALMTLSRHYAPPPATSRRAAHHWGTEDFRPGNQDFGKMMG